MVEPFLPLREENIHLKYQRNAQIICQPNARQPIAGISLIERVWPLLPQHLERPKVEIPLIAPGCYPLFKIVQY